MDEYTESLIASLQRKDRAFSTALLEKEFETSRGEWSWEKEESLNILRAKVEDYIREAVYLKLSGDPVVIEMIKKYKIEAYLPE